MNIPDHYELSLMLSATIGNCNGCDCGSDEDGYHTMDCASTTEVRLQVTEDDWEIHVGSPDYDQDHHGHWAATTVAAEDAEETIHMAAAQLLEQIQESISEEDDVLI